MIEALLAISVAAGIFSLSKPAAGTYTLTQDGSSIVRMDTRNGKMERCSLTGNTLTCKTVVPIAQTQVSEK